MPTRSVLWVCLVSLLSVTWGCGNDGSQTADDDDDDNDSDDNPTGVASPMIPCEGGYLDPETSQEVIGFFEEFNREGRTIVMVTHDPRAAERAGRTLKLRDGRILSEGNGQQPSLHVA